MDGSGKQPKQTTANEWSRRLRAVLAACSKVSVANDLALRGVSNTNKHYASLILYGMALMKGKTMDAQVVSLFLKVSRTTHSAAVPPARMYSAVTDR